MTFGRAGVDQRRRDQGDEALLARVAGRDGEAAPDAVEGMIASEPAPVAAMVAASKTAATVWSP
jgi:hypothetical protein